MNQVFEDKLDRKRYIECANNYYFLKQQINRQYLFQMAFTFETPSAITNLFHAFKTKAELVTSKILVLRIFQNLVNGPESVVKMLSVSSIDVFPSVLKLLVKPKQGHSSSQESKNTKILSPIVTEIFREIVKHARGEIIDIMEYTPGIRVLLREAELAVPQKLNLSQLSSQIQAIKSFFTKEREQIIYEIKAVATNAVTVTKFKDPLANLRYLHSQSLSCLEHILSWFKHYFFTCKEVAVIVEAKRLVDFVSKIAQQLIQNIKEFAQVNPIALEIITLYAVFLENISNMGLHYVLFNKNDKENSKKMIQWMFSFIFYTYNFHAGIEHSNPEDSLRRYHENQLTPIAHIFMRILVTLTEVDNTYMHDMLNLSGFGRFYIDIVRKQHALVKAFINTQTENIHVLQYYVEETNFRIVCFENTLSGSNTLLKDFLMENDFIKYICSSAFQDETEFQVGLYRSTLKFLPFRNFAPLRNEALSMITALVWHQSLSERLYKDLLIQVSNEHLIKRECSNLRKHSSKSNPFLTALYFFTVLVNTNEDKLLFLMKFEKVFEFLQEFFDNNADFKKYFPILYATVRKQYSAV